MAGRHLQLLSIAVIVLFIHSIFQQSIISTIREELRVVLRARSDKSTDGIGSVEGDFNLFLSLKSPPALPSVLLDDVADEKANTKRDIYGGKKDALHLGGFTEIDPMGISENLWNFMFGPMAIKSIIDVTLQFANCNSHPLLGWSLLCFSTTNVFLSVGRLWERPFNKLFLEARGQSSLYRRVS